MRKAISFLLALTLCFGLCACGNTDKDNGEKTEREMISVDKLISDLENLARAEQNVGKAVHLFGSITSIGKNELTMNHLFINRSFTIPMDSEILAKLNKKDFIAIYAVIDEINDGNFEFEDCKQIDMKLMDEYVVGIVSTSSTYDLIVKYSSTIADYIVSREATFRMTDDAEISSFILGKWNWPYGMGTQGTFISTVEYFENGECIWQSWHEYMNHWKNSYCDWSVKDGIFNGCSASDTPVYKITENAFVHSNTLYVRVEETNTNEESGSDEPDLGRLVTFYAISLSDANTANTLLTSWQSGDATAASMKALMEEHGADQGGGQVYELYERFCEHFLPEISAWCLDTARSAGDATILQTDYGYTIVYIVSSGK